VGERCGLVRRLLTLLRHRDSGRSPAIRTATGFRLLLLEIVPNCSITIASEAAPTDLKIEAVVVHLLFCATVFVSQEEVTGPLRSLRKNTNAARLGGIHPRY